MQSSDPDVRLMLAFRAGDESALSDLYRRWAGPLLRFLERMVRERSIAEELMQETFLRVHGARDRYAPDARFSTWLYRIAFNLCVNRSERQVPREARALAEGVADELHDPQVPDPSTALERDDVVRAVRAAIAALPGRQRMALLLARYHEVPLAEIGTVLGIGEKAAKSLVHRAREGLRQELAPFLEREMR